MKYNNEQLLAIYKRGGNIKNILVSAGAGSGKTAVLAERVIELVCNAQNNINIDDLLIMTFTKNAASEMRERIADKLKAKRDELLLAGSTGSDEIINIKKQLSLLNRANITTIDSFCNMVVRQYFYKVDIDPGYRIAGDDSCQELTRLADNAMDELFEEKFALNDSNFLMLMEYFCPEDYNDKKLREILTNINRLLSSVPYPDKWLDEALSVYDNGNAEIMNDKMLALLKKYIHYLYGGGLGIISKAFGLIAQVREAYSEDTSISCNSKLLVYEKAFLRMREILESCIADNMDYTDLYNLFSGSLPAFRGGGRDVPKELDEVFEVLKECKDTFKKRFWDRLQKDIFIYKPDEVKNIVSRHYKIISALFSLLKEFNLLYIDKKNELSLASFSDINHYCIKILLNDDGTPTSEALEFRDRFAEVIVDEYQDNNTLQEYILNAITFNRNNLFMVGDIKQSIYKFRHACPEIFAHKYNSFNKEDLSHGNICIRLNTNYRSRKSVLDTVNFIFYQLMRSDFGNIEYNKADALAAGADFPPPDESTVNNICSFNELLLCKKTVSEDDFTEELADIEELETNEIEAHIIAQRISQLIDETNPAYVFDRKLNSYRPCRLSDITILMRSSNKAGHTYAGILSRYGIPTVSNSRYSLFDELEIKTIMALLKVLDNPYRDKELITILHSPIFNLSCAELAVIRLINKKGTIYDNMLQYINSADSSDNLRKKLEKFISLSEKLRVLNLTKPFCEVLNTIYRLTDYMNYASIIRNGSIRIENLKILSNIAEEIFNSGVTDFSGIVRGLCDIEAENPQFDSVTLSEYDNAVQIMSIHKSKGLEFPIVFLAQLNKDLQRMGTEPDVIVNADMGIGFKQFDTNSRIKTPFLYRTAMYALAKADSLTEELRLLYVALTRAKEKLIMVGVVKDMEKSSERWQEFGSYTDDGLRLPLYAVSGAKSYLDWIMLAHCRRDKFNNELIKHGIDIIDIDSLLNIHIKSLDEIKADELDISRIRNIYDKINPKEAPKKEKAELDNRLIADYLDRTAVILPSKISISEIKRQHQLEAYKQLECDLSLLNAPSSENIIQRLSINRDKDTAVKFDDPDFLTADKPVLYGAQRGTAYHTVFEHLILDDSSYNSLTDSGSIVF